MQDITALPGMEKLESSPHLRPANPNKAVSPYNLDRGSGDRMGVSSRTSESTSSPAMRSSQSPRSTAPQRRKSGKQRDQSLRDEEIRAMSAPMQISKRPAGVNNDLLRRDSKKARRTLTKRTPEDSRGSNVSLPLQDAIHSSMSGNSEQRGWQVSAIGIFSARPTVRLSGPAYSQQQQTGQSSARISRKSSKKERLPTLAQDTHKKDRRRIADLADDLDASELRTVLERDMRRKEQKDIEQQEKLERKLQRRAEKQRLEEETRAREVREARNRAIVTPPTATHPAFRNQEPEPNQDETPVGGLLTPVSTKENQSDVEEQERGRPTSKGDTYLNYVTLQKDNENPFDDPEEEGPFADPLPVPTTPGGGLYYSPVQTPMEEPVVGTAQAVHLSQSHMSPPNSPLHTTQAAGSQSQLQHLQRERTSSIPTRPVASAQRRTSEASARRPGTWATFFRRGPSSRRGSDEPASRPDSSFVNTSRDFSFANTSRESMSKQVIPAHLIQLPSNRRSGNPARTQSRFREDLPELPLSPPDSRVHSPDMTVTVANAAAVRRAKRSTQQEDEPKQPTGRSSADPIPIRRTDSPIVPERQDSVGKLSQSLASADTEGSWISGRPPQRTSSKTQARESIDSLAKTKNDFNASYDKLPVPDHEYFNAITPNVGSRRQSDEITPPRIDEEVTSAGSEREVTGSTEDGTPLRKGTASRRPTVVHNDPRFKSREALMADYQADEHAIAHSREGSISGDSAENSPIEQSYMHKARSVTYGGGHGKTLSAGSAKLLEIAPSSRRGSARPSPQSSPVPVQTEFQRPPPYH